MLFTTMSGRSMQHSVLVGLIVCLAIASGISCSSVGSSNNITMCLETERDALLRFKQGLVDDSNVLASWITEKDCCKWRGIRCNNHTGHVTGLNISINIIYDEDFNRVGDEIPLRGEISPSLFELKYLNYLDLSNNDFGRMMIPKFIGSLSRLKELKLVEANFSGHVPAQLGNLSNLHTLDLSQNYYIRSENLEWLSHLSSLTYLDMSLLDLSKVVNWPQSLSKLTSLRELHLSSCNLPNVNIKSSPLNNSSTSLQLLDLSFNHLNSTSIFYWIANVSTDFVHINLQSNELEGPIPNVFLNLCRLESFILLDNKLSGNIEDSIQALSCANNTLETLELWYNQFWGSFPELTGFSKLRYFCLSENNLNGSLPESVGQLSVLEVLNLNGNSMSGVITESHFRNLSRLRSFDLSDNGFSINISSDWNPPFELTDSLGMSSCKMGPAFPKWILKQTNIVDLRLSNTGLSGSLPDNFGDLFPRLGWLDLSMNQIHGELPNCWMHFQDFYSLNLEGNKLSGKLPSSLSSLQKIQELRLHGNNFSGELPSLENCTNLYIVDLGNNNLSGKIPSWIGQSTQDLFILRLSSNQFDGIIPLSLCNLATIHVLDLSHNNISGSLPHCFNNISALASDSGLVFKMELVWKGIEIEFGENLLGMRSIDMSCNYLVGELPPSIASMTELKSLNLSRNYLTGNLPEDFGNMKMLESLDLSRNNLSGNIPASFSKLNFLGVLDVSHNHLSGRIPLGTQLQGFNDSAYKGNPGLCGMPLTQHCSGDGTTENNGSMRVGAIDDKEHDNDGLISLGFSISTVLGFVSGFWIVCGSLVLKSSWRYAYFKFSDDLRDWIYVKMAVYKAKMQRRLQI